MDILSLVCYSFSVNAELYCKIGIPFVMGTTGGDRLKLNQIVKNSNVYAVISPQMGKQVPYTRIAIFHFFHIIPHINGVMNY